MDGGTNGFVTGTLSGLVEGDNAGPGITATVTSSPGGEGLGSGYNFQSGSGFVVTGGNINSADAQFYRDWNGFGFLDPTTLSLGTFGNGDGGFSSGLNNPFFSYIDFSNSSTIFTPVSAAVPFELNSTAGLATLGICFGAAKLRRKHIAKKLVVS